MAMKVEAARPPVYTAAARAQRGEPGLGFISAAAKCFASDVAMDVTESAVQLFGGAGYTRDFPVERMMRDAKITQTYEGTNQIQHIVMSRAILAAPEPQRFAADDQISERSDSDHTKVRDVVNPVATECAESP